MSSLVQEIRHVDTWATVGGAEYDVALELEGNIGTNFLGDPVAEVAVADFSVLLDGEEQDNRELRLAVRKIVRGRDFAKYFIA